MMNDNITIRLETKDDYRAVENLTREGSNLTTVFAVNVQETPYYKALLSPSYRHSIHLPGICRSTSTSIFDTRSYRNGENYRTDFLNTRS